MTDLASEPVSRATVSAAVDASSFIEQYDHEGRCHQLDLTLDISDEEAVGALATMVMTRRLDTELIRLQRQGQLGVYPSCLGQEAAQVGAALALGPEDWVFPQYRELGIATVKGVPPTRLAHLWRGTWLADRNPSEHRYALTQITIGTQALQATGFAMGARFDGNPIVVLACLGDGATSTGDVHEAMNFAGVFQAPCVFFVQNNQYAISVPFSQQTRAATIAQKAAGYGMPGFRCDGNDVLATYAVTKEAIEHARHGGGPSVVEAVTYRMEAHTTSDDPTRYRTKEELETAADTDPIARFRRYLEQQDLLPADTFEAIEARADQAATLLRDEIYEAPHGDPMEVFEHVYVDATGHYERQRQLLRAELDARGESGGV